MLLQRWRSPGAALSVIEMVNGGVLSAGFHRFASPKYIAKRALNRFEALPDIDRW